MSLVSIEDPQIQGFLRGVAQKIVDIPKQLGMLFPDNAKSEPSTEPKRPEPGSQERCRFSSVEDGVRFIIITEWRVNDLTRRVYLWEIESGKPVLDVVYAEGGDEELEQVLVDEPWLRKMIRKASAPEIPAGEPSRV